MKDRYGGENQDLKMEVLLMKLVESIYEISYDFPPPFNFNFGRETKPTDLFFQAWLFLFLDNVLNLSLANFIKN